MFHQGIADFWVHWDIFKQMPIHKEIIPLACKSKWEIFFLMGILNLASVGMEIIKIHSSKSFIMERKSYYYIFDHSSIILHGRKGENIMSTSWQLLNSFAMQMKETTKDLVTL